MDQILPVNRMVREAPLYVSESNELTVAIASLSIGGAERIVLDWAERIYPRWRVHIIVLRSRAVEWPLPSHVRVTRLEDPDRLEAYAAAGSHHNRRLAQLVALGQEVARGPNPTIVCHLLGHDERAALGQFGASVVNVLHNAKDGWPEGVERLHDASLTVAVSGACASELHDQGFTGPVSVIRHIPPVAKTKQGVREQCRTAWRIPATATVIGMVGAVKRQKDYVRALKILKVLHETTDAYLVILGGPLAGADGRKYWEEVVAAVYELGLRHRVAMPGFIAHATECLPAFDIVLNTSKFEGLSIATLEALQSGRSVVASAVGGQGEITSPALTLVAASADEEAWAMALATALSTPVTLPDWKHFPAFRLWTLMGLARPFTPTDETLFVTANLNSGGAQRSLVNLACALGGDTPFSVAVAGPSTASYYYEELEAAGVSVVRTANTFDPFDHAEMLVKKICDERIGTVCFWNLDAKVKLLVMKALHHTTVRFVDVSPGNDSFIAMGELERFGQLIAYGEHDYNERLTALVLKYHGHAPAALEARTHVIPNGVPPPPVHKQSYAVMAAPRVVVCGRIAPTKFLLEIIEAVRLARHTVSNLELHVYGGTEPRHEAYAEQVWQSAERALGAAARFHGQHFEAARYFPENDAFVVLGHDQGCPNALLEALSVGMPSIGNDSGGTREQLIDGVTGLLLPSTEPGDLADALVRIVSDRELAERLGKAGRAHVLSTFSMEAMVRAYRTLLWA